MYRKSLGKADMVQPLKRKDRGDLVEWLITSAVATGGTDHLLIAFRAKELASMNNVRRLVGGVFFADPLRAGRKVAHQSALALRTTICEPDLHRHAK
jgi:hypothetical protein